MIGDLAVGAAPRPVVAAPARAERKVVTVNARGDKVVRRTTVCP